VPVRAQLGVTTFGLQAKPVIPFTFFDPVTVFERPHIQGSLELTGGFAFGMVVRTGLTKSISLETGINQITRRYDFNIANDTNGYTDAGKLRYIGYEIPVMALVYIRLGERSWMNNALGFSADMYPSDATRVLEYGQAYLFRRNWIQFGVVGNIGVEYRTEKSGYFYLGVTYHRPFNDMAQADVTWFDDAFFPYRVTELLDGSYLTADLRYFFHENPDKAQLRKARRSK
jgi:hypothetical protein